MFLKNQLLPILIALGVCAAFAPACGGNNAASKVKPKEATASSQLGGAGCASTGVATPLIVDLPDRASIESVMLDGVAFVKYDCNTIEVLPDCSLSGEYDYRGLSRQEEMVSLENQDELEANMLFTGGKGGAGLQSGNALNIGLITVGRTSTAARVSRDNMSGSQCAQATHYIKQAYVGAFAMKTMQKGKVSAAVDVFAVGGGSASSSSSNSRDRKGGDLSSCKSASPDSKSPVNGCRSLLRLMLSPVPEKLVTEKDEKKKESKKKERVVEMEVCPKGMVFSGGKCATPKADIPQTCQPTQADECLKQCNNGDAKSCYFYGELMYNNFCKDPSKKSQCDAALADTPEGEKLYAANDRNSAAFMIKGCDANIAESCYAAASSLMSFKDTEKQVPGVLDKACALGHGEACYDSGDIYLSGTYGVSKAAFTGLGKMERGCSLGYMGACSDLGQFYFTGEHVGSKNPVKGVDFLKQFCDQGDANICYELGSHILGTYSDNGLNDPIKPSSLPGAMEVGLEYLSKGCKKKDQAACLEAARVLYKTKKYDQAKIYFDAGLAISDGYTDSFVMLADMYLKGLGVEKNKAKAVDYWQKADEKAYLLLGADALKRGKGVIKDKERAAKMLTRACALEDEVKYCKEAEKLDRSAYEKEMFANFVQYESDWMHPVAQKIDPARYRKHLEAACAKYGNDPTDDDCKRLKALR